MISKRFEATKSCRWCGGIYYAMKPIDRDGFCTKACKQAHYRAHKKYVTAAARQKAWQQRMDIGLR